MRTREFERLYPKYHKVLWAIAFKLTKRYPGLRADCYQAGLIRLKELQLTDVSKERQYITAACRFAMIDELRRNHPKRYITFLQAHAHGYNFMPGHNGGIEIQRQSRGRGRTQQAPEWLVALNGVRQ